MDSEAILFLFGSYRSTVMLATVVLTASIAAGSLLLRRKVLEEEEWLKFFGWTFAVFAVQHFILAMYAWLELLGWRDLLGLFTAEFARGSHAICSALNNLFLLATGRALYSRRPHIPWLIVAIAVLSATPGFVGGIQNPAIDIWQTRLPDMVFSAVCVLYLGGAMSSRIAPRVRDQRRGRQRRLVAGVVFWSTAVYAALFMAYAFFPLVEGLDLGANEGLGPVKALDAMAFALAFVLKLPLVGGSAVLVARSLVGKSPYEIRTTLAGVTHGRVEFLSSEGILRAIGRNFSADVVELCMKWPGLRQQMIWWRWLADEGTGIGNRKSVNYEFGGEPSPVSRLGRALASGNPYISPISSPRRLGLMQREESNKISVDELQPSWVAVPISYHGAVIGAFNIEWNIPNVPTPTMVHQIGLFGDLLAPAAEASRQKAALLELGVRFHKHEIRPPEVRLSEVASGFLRRVHQVISPLATGISIDIGFGCAWAVQTDEKQDHGQTEEPNVERLKERVLRIVPTAGSPVEVVSAALDFQGVTLGHMLFAVCEKADERDRPTLIKNWLLRDTVARMVGDAIFDAVRVKLWANLNELQLKMSAGKVETLERWFALLEEAVSDAGLVWITASCPEHPEMGPPHAIEIVHNLANLGERMPLGDKGPVSATYRLHQPVERTRHVLELPIGEGGARLWLGIERPGFQSELYHLWPWSIYLERLAVVAGGALAKIEVGRLRDEAWEFRGIATASIITGALSHDMGNLALNILRTGKDLQQRLPKLEDDELEEKIQKRLKWLLSSAFRVRELTEQIQDVTRIDRQQPCDLHKVARKVEALYADTLRERHIELEISLQPRLLVDLPAFAPTLALANLVGNSIYSIGAHGTIRVETQEHDDRVECVVTDSGPGIDPSIENRLFEKGFSTRVNGTGIGLYLSQRILGEYRSEIRLLSGAPGNTRLKIVMPKTNGKGDIKDDEHDNAAGPSPHATDRDADAAE